MQKVSSYLPLLLFFCGFSVAWFHWLYYWAGLGFVVYSTLVFRKNGTFSTFLFFLAGSEVVYRMAPDKYPWEMSRYGFILTLLFAILSTKRPKDFRLIGIFSFLLVSLGMCPLAPLNQIKSSLLGPLCLCLFLAYPWRFENWDIKKIAFGLMLPSSFLLGICTLGFFFNIFYVPAGSPEEMFRWVYRWRATTLSFGPNQVGWTFSFFFLIFSSCNFLTRQRLYKWVAIACFTACILCFSRGPIIASIVTFFAFKLYRSDLKWLIFAPVFLVILIFPGLVFYRFTALEDSGRVKNAISELYLFKQNPVFGVGPGNGKEFRESFSGASSSHVEWLRMLSEHGIFGLLFMCLTGYAIYKRDINWQVWGPIGFWCFCYFSHSGFRGLGPVLFMLWGRFLSYLHDSRSQDKYVTRNHG